MYQNKPLEQGLEYAALGLQVFPVHSIQNGVCSCGNKSCDKPGKHPRTKNGFKDATTDESRIRNWWRVWPSANVAIATGAISGIVVLDLDKKHGRTSKEFDIPITVSAKTGGGGEHILFKHPGGHIKSTNGQLFGAGVDIKADGGYVVVAPSSHISGDCYEWTISPGEEEFADMPKWLSEAISGNDSNEKQTEKLWQKDPKEIVEGMRNETAASVAGKLKQSLPTSLTEVGGWAALFSWNQNMTNPLPENELRSVWESIKKYPNQKEGGDEKSPSKDSQADRLLKGIMSRKDIRLFHDEYGEGYIALEVNGHRETWQCKSKAIKDWLANEVWKVEKKAFGSETIKSVISVLEGNARHGGNKYKLNNRVGWNNDELWYDLTNKDWQAVKINKDGWEIMNEPPILFKRYSHSQEQVMPIRGGNVKLFLDYININDSEHKLLLLVFLVSCFIPDFPHAMLIIFGVQGSSKSTLAKLTRLIIDPSLIDVASIPSTHNEFIQLLAHHYFIFFDNITHISQENSDDICKAITGSGFMKRVLYENDEDMIYQFKRCIGINGINLVATRPDLLERSLLIELQRVDPEKRKVEKNLYEQFEKDTPSILGGIFDVIAEAIKRKPDIKVDTLPRMADFALWGCAIAEALGHSKEEFLTAYQHNIDRQSEMLLNENIVATAIILFMSDKEEWKGTPTNLLDHLTNHASFANIDMRETYWPKGAGALSRRLNELSTNLKHMGILVTISTSGTERSIYIKKVAKSIKV